MNDSIIKLFIAFIAGGVVIGIGMAIQLIAIVLLGGLLLGVSALMMLIVVWLDR